MVILKAVYLYAERIMSENDDLYVKIKQQLNALLPRGKAEELARTLNIPKSTLSNWRHQNRAGVPNLIEAYKLANAMGMSLYDLIDPQNKHRISSHPTVLGIVKQCESLDSGQLAQLNTCVKMFLSLSKEDRMCLLTVAERLSTLSQVSTNTTNNSHFNQEYSAHIAAENPPTHSQKFSTNPTNSENSTEKQEKRLPYDSSESPSR